MMLIYLILLSVQHGCVGSFIRQYLVFSYEAGITIKSLHLLKENNASRLLAGFPTEGWAECSTSVTLLLTGASVADLF